MYRVTLTAAPLSPRAATMKARHLSVRTAIPAPAHRIELNRATVRAPAFVPRVMSSRLLVGNSGSISLLGGICHSAVGSPLRSFTYHSKGLFMKTEHFPLWEICSFCLCFCPHRMFLSAPCKGTGNYRAVHLHPHNFRQIL